jgi:hypothetical protein
MSVTITGGISFSGGVSMVAAPPSVATAGWFAGGQLSGPGSPMNLVQRMTFATDTAAPTSRGPLSSSVYGLAAAGTLTDGWFGGGYGVSIVQRITYSTDTATASVRGPLAQNKFRMGATSDSTTYGWYGGGAGPYASGSAVNRIVYATDTATASIRGPLNASVYYNTATGNSSYGWYAGGGSTIRSSIDRVDYANDTATASVRGPLSAPTFRFAGAVTDSTTYGWFAGGNPGPGATATVSRITYANDTVTTTNRGPLASTRYSNSGTNSDGTYGWFGAGGNPGFTYLSSITRITYANDTATSTDRGSLGTGRANLAGSSGLQ